MFAQDPQLKDNLIKLQISGSHNFIAAINNSLGPSVKVPDLILVNAEPGHESLWCGGGIQEHPYTLWVNIHCIRASQAESIVGFNQDQKAATDSFIINIFTSSFEFL